MSLADPGAAALNNIISVAHEFQQPTDQTSCQACHRLSTQRAGTINIVSDILCAKDKDIPELITTKVIKCMSEQQSD